MAVYKTGQKSYIGALKAELDKSKQNREYSMDTKKKTTKEPNQKVIKIDEEEKEKKKKKKINKEKNTQKVTKKKNQK